MTAKDGAEKKEQTEANEVGRRGRGRSRMKVKGNVSKSKAKTELPFSIKMTHFPNACGRDCGYIEIEMIQRDNIQTANKIQILHSQWLGKRNQKKSEAEISV